MSACLGVHMYVIRTSCLYNRTAKHDFEYLFIIEL